MMHAVDQIAGATEIGERQRYAPAIRPVGARAALGATLLLVSVLAVASVRQLQPWPLVLSVALAWAVSSWLTDKYRHKYPQRYDTYLLASHGKAAVIMAALLAVYSLAVSSETAAGSFHAALLFVLADYAAMLPRRRVAAARPQLAPAGTAAPADPEPVVAVNGREIVQALTAMPDIGTLDGLSAFVAGCIGSAESGAQTVQLIDSDRVPATTGRHLAMLVQMKSMNSVRRLNLFMQGLPEIILMGGSFVFRYRPMDDELETLRSTGSGPRFWASYLWHFLRHRALPKIPVLEHVYFAKPLSGLDAWLHEGTKRPRRVISRAEMWGRIYYWGFEVLGEQLLAGDHWIVARRVRAPQMAKKPSFFMVARLTKLGLDEQPVYLHKIRTMYPFSEFVQEKLYQDHGLAELGKFKNDFRLTDYGRVLRRYWLDEIPQLFDWLRGEVKLVGMRATSAHFMSLYPRDLYELYIRTKPGLIPPIVDDPKAGFDEIVRIEFEYLRRYQHHPTATDVKYLLRTLHDIFIRGVRSK